MIAWRQNDAYRLFGKERPIVRMMERKAKEKLMLVMSLAISNADRTNMLAPCASLRASSLSFPGRGRSFATPTTGVGDWH